MVAKLTKDRERQYRKMYHSRGWYTTLSRVYAKHSIDKQIAFDECERRRIELGGFDARILTSNAQMFTYGFRVGDKIHIMTPHNYYIIDFYGYC